MFGVGRIETVTRIRVLVLGAGSNVSQGIIKALRRSDIPLWIIGACVSEYSFGLYMCDEGYICPYANDKQFIPWVIDFCNEHNIDIIFTGVEENVLQLAMNEKTIREKTKALFISSTAEQLRIGQDKLLTCEWLKSHRCNYPAFQEWKTSDMAKQFAESVGYPVIAKPRDGKSSKGVIILYSPEDIENAGQLENYVLEQYIGDINSEYTIGCYVDKSGVLQGMIALQRRLKDGTTIWARTIDNPVIYNECKKICNCFSPKGPLNIQMRLDRRGTPVCFELNVRFSGTTAIRNRLGFRDVEAMIREYILNEGLDECFNIRSGEVFRFDEEFYIMNGTVDLMKHNGRIESMSPVKSDI